MSIIVSDVGGYIQEGCWRLYSRGMLEVIFGCWRLYSDVGGYIPDVGGYIQEGCWRLYSDVGGYIRMLEVIFANLFSFPIVGRP